MNKIIKDKLKKVGAKSYSESPMRAVTGVSMSFEQVERFAELIVMECGNIVSGLVVPETFEQDIGPYEKWNQALGHAALEIEHHFFGDAHK